MLYTYTQKMFMNKFIIIIIIKDKNKIHVS